MIDLQALKAQVDLLALAGQDTDLKRVAASGGGEWAGPCPFCGGHDRFRVQPHAAGGGRWLCRGCTEGQWQDAIAYAQRKWPELSFQEVCARLAGGALPKNVRRRAKRTEAAPTMPAYRAPQGEWQAYARQAVEHCAANLWDAQGEAARRYLIGRGLQEHTLRHWQLGYSSGARFGPRGGGLWVPSGVVIPCLVRGELWYLKVALMPEQPVRCMRCRERVPARQACPQCGTINKYRGVRGNRPAAIFGADELIGAELALFVEGEFDALIAWQELRDVIAVCTLGSATNRPDLATWGAYLAPLEHLLAVYDADEAGRKGLQALQALSERVLAVNLPDGAKDINDYVLAGGQLWPWLKGVVEDNNLVGEL